MRKITLGGWLIIAGACFASSAWAQPNKPPEPATIRIPYHLDTPEHVAYLEGMEKGGNATLRIRAVLSDDSGKPVWSWCQANVANEFILFQPDTDYFNANVTAWLSAMGNIILTDLDNPNGPTDEGSFAWMIKQGCDAEGFATIERLPPLRFIVTLQPSGYAIQPSGGLVIGHVALQDGRTTILDMTNRNIKRRGEPVSRPSR